MAIYEFEIEATDIFDSKILRTFSISISDTEKQQKFVAISENDAWSSPDGITWKYLENLGGYSITYGGGKFFIVQSDNTYLLSNDGNEWTQYMLPNNMSFCYQSRMYYYKRSKTNEAIKVYPFKSRPNFINGKWYVTVRKSSSDKVQEIYSSSDGITWRSVVSINSSVYTPISHIVSDINNRFLIMGQNHQCSYYENVSNDGLNTSPLFVSNDGLKTITESLSQFPKDMYYRFTDLKYYNRLWIMTSTMNTSYSSSCSGFARDILAKIYYSYNGSEWYESTFPKIPSLYSYDLTQSSSNYYNYNFKIPGRICCGNGIFLLSTYGNNGFYNTGESYSSYSTSYTSFTNIIRSTNAKIWDLVAIPDMGSVIGAINSKNYYNTTWGKMTNIAYSVGMFVLAGPNGLCYSDDGGETWKRGLTWNYSSANPYGVTEADAIHDVAGYLEY